VPLEPERRARIEEADRKRHIFRVTPRTYYRPTTLAGRAVVALGGMAFWAVLAVTGLALGAAVSAVLFGDVVYDLATDVADTFQPRTRTQWAAVLLLGVPAYGFCWWVIGATYRSLDGLFRSRHPEGYRWTRALVIWTLAAAFALIMLSPLWR
jgi:hypothetical protein